MVRMRRYGVGHSNTVGQQPARSFVELQCLASASGRNLACIANPYFAGASDDPYAYQNRGRAFPPGYYPDPPMAYPRRSY